MEYKYVDENGKRYTHPIGKEAAEKKRSKIYADIKGCYFCPNTYRYTISDLCTRCARQEASDFYGYVVGELTFVPLDDRETAYQILYKIDRKRVVPKDYKTGFDNTIERELGHSYTTDPAEMASGRYEKFLSFECCKKCGGYGIKNQDGDCHFCETYFKKVSPRQEAIKAGKNWYVPEKPCARCGERAERHVYNGVCKGCRAISKGSATDDNPNTLLMKTQPDIIISRKLARTLGYKVYRTGRPCKHGHTGFRYVSTNGCIDCLKGE